MSASKQLGDTDARRLIDQARKVHVAKGKNLDEFAGGSARPEQIALLLGSTGNLRAPTLRVGKILLVGFNEDVYTRVFG